MCGMIGNLAHKKGTDFHLDHITQRVIFDGYIFSAVLDKDLKMFMADRLYGMQYAFDASGKGKLSRGAEMISVIV
jgi:hypothetical protein